MDAAHFFSARWILLRKAPCRRVPLHRQALVLGKMQPALAALAHTFIGSRTPFKYNVLLVAVTHSVNGASTEALETRLVNSASIMVTRPWFPEMRVLSAAWGFLRDVCYRIDSICEVG
jgi:hypothetical protein